MINLNLGLCLAGGGINCLITIKSPEISLLDTSKMDYLYELGYKQVKNQINKIKKCLLL